MQLHIATAAAVGGVLDVLDHAVALVIHQHDQRVAPFLHQRGKLTQVQDETPIPRQTQRLAA
ncbi:hypothetical protein D3C71_2171860 [compost metagenome]